MLVENDLIAEKNEQQSWKIQGLARGRCERSAYTRSSLSSVVRLGGIDGSGRSRRRRDGQKDQVEKLHGEERKIGLVQYRLC